MGQSISLQQESTDMCYNRDEPWPRYARWKKPVTEDHILREAINVNCPEESNS